MTRYYFYAADLYYYDTARSSEPAEWAITKVCTTLQMIYDRFACAPKTPSGSSVK
jgi:hypothetical protein